MVVSKDISKFIGQFYAAFDESKTGFMYVMIGWWVL